MKKYKSAAYEEQTFLYEMIFRERA